MMQNKQALERTLSQYLKQYPDEIKRQTAFRNYLGRNTNALLYSRKNFDGHLTASAFILDKSLENILLIHHKSLNKWLQPGGHIDATDADILHAAYREISEETGIAKAQLELIQAGNESVPFDIDSHHIPANSKKKEASHYHHDFRYLFCYTGTSDIAINADESLAYKWLELATLIDDEIFGMMVEKIRQQLKTE